MKPLVLIRPEPGLTASAARARAMGLEVVEWPLFHIETIAWTIPDVRNYDAILLTSANAVRMSGSGLSQLFQLPVFAVGQGRLRVVPVCLPVALANGEIDAVWKLLWIEIV